MKIVYVTNIPSPYQIKWAEYVRKEHEVEFWFMTDISNSSTGRPSYWNIDLPDYCRILPSKFKKGEFCYGPTLVKELNAFNPDVVMLGGAWYMISFFQAYRWAVKNNKKILMGPVEFSGELYRISKLLRNRAIFKILYKKIDIFLANAFLHYDYLTMALKVKNVRLFMNYDDYSPYMDHDLRPNSSNKITFMYGGSIDRRMRLPELLTTFEKLARKYNNIELVIGGYGSEKEKCIDMVNSSNILKDVVEFHDVGSWNEIPNVYERCDVLINFASFSPGAGVILSAVASGMGVISTITVNASRHFLIHGYNGFFVNDEYGLFDAIEKYILNKDLVRTHSEINKEIGRKQLTFRSHLDEFNKILESNLSHKTD